MRDTTRPVVFVAFLFVVTLAACGDEPELPEASMTMGLTSAFTEGEPIPAVYTCDGDDISPPLTIDGIPEGTESLVLVVDDPDAPSGTFDHWIVYDIPPTDHIPEGASGLGVSGRNSAGGLAYVGPCPPSGTHRYFFRVYALNTRLGLPEGATKGEVLDAASDHVLAEATSMGTYFRGSGWSPKGPVRQWSLLPSNPRVVVDRPKEEHDAPTL